MGPLLLAWTHAQLDSLMRLYPEIKPYLLAAKVSLPGTSPGFVRSTLRRICSGKDRTPCELACNSLADSRPDLVSHPPCPLTYPVLRALYGRTKGRRYLIELARRYPRSREAKDVLKYNTPKYLKLRVLYFHGDYDRVLKEADTTKPEERTYYLLAKWKTRGLSYGEVLLLPPEFRRRPLIKHLVRFLKAENYDSIEMALLDLVALGDYERAYRVMASEVAKPFLRYEASDLYVRLSATAHEGLDPSSLVWLGLSAYGVHYIEEAYNWFAEAREKAERGSFPWTQATYWLYIITRDTLYRRDLRTYNPVSYYTLDLGVPIPWRDEDVWDTTGSLRNYRIGRLLEGLFGWKVASRWYLKDIPSAYRKARELIEGGNFLRASYVLAAIYSSADRTKGVPRWWGRMAFPYDLYRGEIDSAAKEFGIDPLFLTAIVREESRFKRRARSSAGAIGLAQIMPYNFDKFQREFKERIRNRYAPLPNLRVGAWLLSKSLRAYGSHHLAAAAYNAGEDALNRWLCTYGYELLDFHHFIDIIPYNETRNYVRRVIRSFGVYRSLYGRLKLPSRR
ncbi:MAG: lytic transglycosylase domain-containing protein [Thermotogae bacterium]|nr:lytic transglycosylase domain-containing protein [Thermotogota bacterium]